MRHYVLRKLKDLLKHVLPFTPRMDSEPHTSKAQRMSCEQYVLNCSRTVDDPVVGRTGLRISSAAYDNREGCVSSMPTYGLNVASLSIDSLCEDYELPWLDVPSRRCCHSCPEKQIDLLLFDRLVSIRMLRLVKIFRSASFSTLITPLY